MEILNLIILIGLVILVFYFLNKSHKKKIPKIDSSNIYINNDVVINKTQLDKNNIEKEKKQLNIDKGTITRQTIIDETGGSTHYDNIKIDSNISGNTVNPTLTYSTYAKFPTIINK